ncbi:MAG: hypothetical protein Q8N01_01710, partial [Sulfuricurvum sp.]|nr:hypothetical protein [Sulfuricurvum sp.]
SKLLFGIVVPWSIGCSSYMSLYLWSDKIDSLLHPFDLLLHFKLELAQNNVIQFQRVQNGITLYV